MATVKGYRELVVWQKSMGLAEEVYTTTNSFPKSELYGLTSQMRRAVISIASNIAEGQGRNSTGEFIQFLGIAKGSVAEIETQLELACRLQMLSSVETLRLTNQANEIGRMLTGLIAKLRTKSR
jgi:four helix bundle protein